MLTDPYTMPTRPAVADPAPGVSAPATQTFERRRSPREERIALVALIADGTHDGPPGGEVVLIDTSIGGAGFRSHFPLPLGSRYRLRVDDRPLDEARLVRVVSCRRCNEEGTEWFIGSAYC